MEDHHDSNSNNDKRQKKKPIESERKATAVLVLCVISYLVVIYDVEPLRRFPPGIGDVEVGDEGSPARGTGTMHDGCTLHTDGGRSGAADEARTTKKKRNRQ